MKIYFNAYEIISLFDLGVIPRNALIYIGLEL